VSTQTTLLLVYLPIALLLIGSGVWVVTRAPWPLWVRAVIGGIAMAIGIAAIMFIGMVLLLAAIFSGVQPD
jgi:hypothetical protein